MARKRNQRRTAGLFCFALHIPFVSASGSFLPCKPYTCVTRNRKSYPRSSWVSPGEGAVDLQTIRELNSIYMYHSCILEGEGPSFPKHLGAPSTVSAPDVQEAFRNL